MLSKKNVYLKVTYFSIFFSLSPTLINLSKYLFIYFLKVILIIHFNQNFLDVCACTILSTIKSYMFNIKQKFESSQ